MYVLVHLDMILLKELAFLLTNIILLDLPLQTFYLSILSCDLDAERRSIV